MKAKYNKIINGIIIFILVFPLLALFALKYILKAVARVVEALQAVVKCSIDYTKALYKELVEVLSLKVY